MAKRKVAPAPRASKNTPRVTPGTFSDEFQTEVIAALGRASSFPGELGNLAAGIQAALDDVQGETSADELLSAAARVRAYVGRAHCVSAELASLGGVLEGLVFGRRARDGAG